MESLRVSSSDKMGVEKQQTTPERCLLVIINSNFISISPNPFDCSLRIYEKPLLNVEHRKNATN